MRINKFLARATGLSRRGADLAIRQSRVAINQREAKLGDEVAADDNVTLDNRPVAISRPRLIALNKPVGYVCSRAGQGSRTVYDLLPADYHDLKPIGRLDKDSSGLLLLTDDGDLANRLAHPRYAKSKVYQVTLDKPLAAGDQAKLAQGVAIDDYVSRLKLSPLKTETAPAGAYWQVTISQGRNRQIRHTFETLGYTVKTLHRTRFGSYDLAGLRPGGYQTFDYPDH